MKIILAALCVVMSGANAMAVNIGDPVDSVLAEKGAPVGKMSVGAVEILRYADVTIKLKAGKVISVEKMAPTPARTSPAPAVRMGTAAPGKTTLANQIKEPRFSRSFAGGPTFFTAGGEYDAGSAFLARARHNPQVFVLTAHHLFGPMGGLPEKISHQKLPSFVRGVRIDSFDGESRTYTVTAGYVEDGGEEHSPLEDLAVLKTKDVSPTEVPVLAEIAPKAGDPVWLIAHVRGGVAEGTYIHRAFVIGQEGTWITCELENRNIVTNGASGAAVLNAAGEIVGIYSGHADREGRKIAFIISAELILQVLKSL
jgi:hypothetical protein